VDKRPDSGLHRELAQAGVLLGYDTFVRSKYDPEHGVWPLLGRMVADGLAHRIAIGLDLADSSMWRHYGGRPGMLGMAEDVLPRLRAEGIAESTILKLTGRNIARHLVWQAPGGKKLPG
jgi:phosphotriesterase-related protein